MCEPIGLGGLAQRVPVGALGPRFPTVQAIPRHPAWVYAERASPPAPLKCPALVARRFSARPTPLFFLLYTSAWLYMYPYVDKHLTIYG